MDDRIRTVGGWVGRRRWAVAGVTGVAYSLLAWLLLRVLSPHDALPFWAPDGLALAVALYRRRYLVSACVGVVIGELFIGFVVSHDTVRDTFWWTTANTVEVLVAALVIEWLFAQGRDAKRPELASLLDAVRFVVGAAVGVVVGACIAALAFTSIRKFGASFEFATRYFLGDLLGEVSLGAVGLVVGPAMRLRQRRGRARGWLVAAVTASLTVAAFATEIPIAYLVPPLVGAFALLWGRWGIALALGSMTWAVHATQAGQGPFVIAGRDPLAQLQSFGAALIATVLVAIGLAIDAQRRQDRIDATQERHRRVVDAASEAYLEVEGYEGRVVEVNDRLADLFGLKPEQIVGKTLKSLMPESSWSQSFGARHRIIDGDSAVFEVRMPSPTGERRLIVNGRPEVGEDGQLGRTLMLATDVTEIYAERSARQAIEQRLIDVERAERLRLAQQLHDGPVQLLVAADLRLGRLRRDAPPEVAPTARSVEAMVQEAITSLRQGMLDMRPPDVRGGGLGPALEECASVFLAGSDGVRFELDLDRVSPPTGEAAEVFYKCAREAIVNSVRHAHCSTIRVSLDREGDRTKLSVIDDGQGMDLSFARGREGHLGIGAMHARAEDLGGTCAVSSGSHGTTVTISLPTI